MTKWINNWRRDKCFSPEEFHIRGVVTTPYSRWRLISVSIHACGLDLMTHFQRIRKRKRQTVTSQWRDQANATLTEWSVLTSPVIAHIDVTTLWNVVMRRTLDLCGILPQNDKPCQTMRIRWTIPSGDVVLFGYFRERDRESVHRQGRRAEGGREREKLKQALCSA